MYTCRNSNRYNRYLNNVFISAIISIVRNNQKQSDWTQIAWRTICCVRWTNIASGKQPNVTQRRGWMWQLQLKGDNIFIELNLNESVKDPHEENKYILLETWNNLSKSCWVAATMSSLAEKLCRQHRGRPALSVGVLFQESMQIRKTTDVPTHGFGAALILRTWPELGSSQAKRFCWATQRPQNELCKQKKSLTGFR